MSNQTTTLPREVREILDRSIRREERICELKKEKAGLIRPGVIDLGGEEIRKRLTAVADQWNDLLFKEGYKARIDQGIQAFQDQMAEWKKKLPAAPAVPEGFHSLEEAEQLLPSYRDLLNGLRKRRAATAETVRNCQDSVVECFEDNAASAIRDNTSSAAGTFRFFCARIKNLHQRIPEALREYVLQGVNVHREDWTFELSMPTDAKGALYDYGKEFVPDFQYEKDPSKNDVITRYFLEVRSGKKPKLTRWLTGDPAAQAREWVEAQHPEAVVLDRLRMLVNAQRVEESLRKDIAKVRRIIDPAEKALAARQDALRQQKAYKQAWDEAKTLKGYSACGQFLAGKGLVHPLDADTLKNLQAKMQDACRPYGIRATGLSDIRWNEYAKGTEAAEADKQKLLEAMIVTCLHEGLLHKRRHGEIDQEIQRIAEQPPYTQELEKLFRKDPVMMPVSALDASAEETLRERAAGRFTAPVIPTGQVDGYQGLPCPKIVPWHDPDRPSNLCLEATVKTADKAYNVLNNLLFNMLMAFPTGKVRLHLVDLNLSGRGSFFVLQTDFAVHGSAAVTDETGFRERMAFLQQKMGTVAQQCANLIEYNSRNQTLLAPYDVVVLLDAPRHFSAQQAKSLLPLCENGYKGGVSFVAVYLKDAPDDGGGELFRSDSFLHIPVYESPSSQTNLYANPSARERCLAILREGLEAAGKTPVIPLDVASLRQQAYQPADAGLRVAVGERAGQPFEFHLDQVSHAHAFVLGQSGSGKSVLLRDLILGAALRYAPEDLQLYLIDLKAGGIEFNGYQHLPHTQAALLDDSDRQVILEILRSVSAEIDRRGERIRAASGSVVSLEEYNRAFPDQRFAQVLILVDECQRLFSDRGDRIQKEINDIVDRIAEMGRAFGIHLILATQTLYGTNISAKVRKNISDFYLLRGGMADGLERFIDEAATLDTGQVLYTNRSEKSIFQAYLLDGKDKDATIGQAREKAVGHPANGRFFFTGETVFPLQAEDAGRLRTLSRKGPVCLPGREIAVGFNPLFIGLEEDMSENLLILGSKAENATSLAVQTCLGMMLSDTGARKRHRFYALDCQDDPEMPYRPLLEALEPFGCRLVAGKERGTLIASLGREVRSGSAEPTVVLLLGQERFRQVRVEDTPLPGAEPAAPAPDPTLPAFLQQSARGGGSLMSASRPATYRSELRYLLENGAEQGVHFIWQVDSLSNLLSDSGLSRQSLMKMFRHVLMLRSLPDSVIKLGLPPEVVPDQLGDGDGRIRAWWIDLMDNRFRLFTPLRTPRPEDLETLFKTDTQ